MGGIGDLPQRTPSLRHHCDRVEPACQPHNVFGAPHQDDVGIEVFQHTVIILTPDHLAIPGRCRAGQEEGDNEDGVDYLFFHGFILY